MKCRECGYKNLAGSFACKNCFARLFLARLRVTLDSGQDQTHYLFPRNYKIGRGEDQDVMIDDVSVSRAHVEIAYEQGMFSISEKNSKNGSLLNNETFEYRPLRDMDCIQIGNVTMHFYEERNGRPGLFSTEAYVQEEFLKIAQKRQTLISTEALLKTMLNLASSLIHAERAALFRVDASGELELRFSAGGQSIFKFDLDELERSFMEQAMQTKQQGVENGTDEQSRNWQKIALPLLANEFEVDELGASAVLGVCFFLNGEGSKPISKRKQELLFLLRQQMSAALENEILYNEKEEKRRLTRELALAKQIQERLTSTKPELKCLEIATFANPYHEVSGDYFDIIPISEREVGIAIGDVCGKGIPAALLAATVQAAIRSQLEYSTSPGQIMDNLNRLLIESTADSMFVTLFFGILEIESGILEYVNAGHPPPILIKKECDAQELSATTLALGILASEPDCVKTVEFETADILLLYTDGVIEGRGENKSIYGRQRLLEGTLASIKKEKQESLNLESILKNIVRELEDFTVDSRQKDDLTLLAIKRKG